MDSSILEHVSAIAHIQSPPGWLGYVSNWCHATDGVQLTSCRYWII